MQRDTFIQALDDNQTTIAAIRDKAHAVHAAVNQHYDGTLPYGVHLDRAAAAVVEYGHSVCQSPDDVVPLMFGILFHDSIEDARLTYKDVLRLAKSFMDQRQALMATEIVYALTNEKGRNRTERANDKYYSGIRCTPYAPLCKMADRIANVSYSAEHKIGKGKAMIDIYARENPHFMEALAADGGNTDPRCTIPAEMALKLGEYFEKNI